MNFAHDFVIHVVYSDDPRLASSDNTASFDIVVASATADSVPAPNYFLDPSGLSIHTDVANVALATTMSKLAVLSELARRGSSE